MPFKGECGSVQAKKDEAEKKDEPMPDAAGAAPAENGSAAEAGPETAGPEQPPQPSAAGADGPAPMETEAVAQNVKEEKVKKKRTKKLPVPFKTHLDGLSDKAVQVRKYVFRWRVLCPRRQASWPNSLCMHVILSFSGFCMHFDCGRRLTSWP